MPKRLTAMRLSVLTEQQLEALAARFGMNKTEVIQLAIDRLYQLEIGEQSAQSNAQQQERSNANERKNYKARAQG
jgi:predicted DNA-binding protein